MQVISVLDHNKIKMLTISVLQNIVNDNYYAIRLCMREEQEVRFMKLTTMDFFFSDNTPNHFVVRLISRAKHQVGVLVNIIAKQG